MAAAGGGAAGFDLMRAGAAGGGRGSAQAKVWLRELREMQRKEPQTVVVPPVKERSPFRLPTGGAKLEIGK